MGGWHLDTGEAGTPATCPEGGSGTPISVWPALPSGLSLFPHEVVLIWALACYIRTRDSKADLHAWGKAVAVKLQEPRAGSLPRPGLQSRWLPAASAKAAAGCGRMCHENPANHPRATHRGGDQRQGEHSASPKAPARGCTGLCAGHPRLGSLRPKSPSCVLCS